MELRLSVFLSAGPVLALFFGTVAASAQVLSVDEAVKLAEATNRSLEISRLDQHKARDELNIARSYRLPAFSLTALGSQSLSRLGLTLEKGSLGTYQNAGPIPGRTTTLQSPLKLAGIFFASVAQPLSQQHRIGLQVQLARLGVKTSEQQLRAKRQSTVNQVRRLYYGILQAESGKKSLRTTVEFLRELERDTRQNELQRVVLRADALNVKAQLAEAEYELLKLEDPLQTQRQQLNQLMGRDVNTPFEVEPLSVTSSEMPDLTEACAKAMESRPEIRLARLKARAANIGRRITNAERIPDVSLSATAVSTANLSNILPASLVGVGVQVNWDVFDWKRKRDKVDEARFTEEQASLELKDVEAAVVVEVSHQYRRLVEARKKVEVEEKRQAAAQEWLRVARNQYAQKEALLSDLLKAQSGLVESNHRLTQALLDLATAQADLEKAVGEDQ